MPMFGNVPVSVILLCYLAFAAIFLFLHLHRRSQFLKLFALAWTIEAARAGVLIVEELQVELPPLVWTLDSIAFSFVIWMNLAAVASFVGIQLSRAFSVVFLSASTLAVTANLVLAPVLVRAAGWDPQRAAELKDLLDSLEVFVPGAFLSLWIAWRLWGYWRRAQLPGALIAAAAFVFHSLGCLSAPLELASGRPLPLSNLFWLFEVLFLSVGSLILALNRQLADLKTAEGHVKTLSGLLPICASCKSIRDDNGYWNRVDVYLTQHADMLFSHGICPDCTAKLYPDYVDQGEVRRAGKGRE